jgi:hypothetical protein
MTKLLDDKMKKEQFRICQANATINAAISRSSYTGVERELTVLIVTQEIY